MVNLYQHPFLEFDLFQFLVTGDIAKGGGRSWHAESPSLGNRYQEPGDRSQEAPGDTTSLLTAAVSMAVPQILPSEQSEVTTVVTSNLRRLAAAAAGDSGVIQHVAALSLVFWLHPLPVTSEADIWMLAAQCDKQLHGPDIL